MSFEDVLNAASLARNDILDWREARLLEDESSSKGFLLLTKKDLLFVRDKGLLSGARVLFSIPVNKITSVKKMLGLVIVQGNLAEKDAGFLKKLFKSKGAQFKMKDADSFIKKINGLRNG